MRPSQGDKKIERIEMTDGTNKSKCLKIIERRWEVYYPKRNDFSNMSAGVITGM